MWRFKIERHAENLAKRILAAGVAATVAKHADIVTGQLVWIVEIKGMRTA